jgi:hypothetical protein
MGVHVFMLGIFLALFWPLEFRPSFAGLIGNVQPASNPTSYLPPVLLLIPGNEPALPFVEGRFRNLSTDLLI